MGRWHSVKNGHTMQIWQKQDGQWRLLARQDRRPEVTQFNM
jgi:hypothetical protein